MCTFIQSFITRFNTALLHEKFSSIRIRLLQLVRHSLDVRGQQVYLKQQQSIPNGGSNNCLIKGVGQGTKGSPAAEYQRARQPTASGLDGKGQTGCSQDDKFASGWLQRMSGCLFYTLQLGLFKVEVFVLQAVLNAERRVTCHANVQMPMLLEDEEVVVVVEEKVSGLDYTRSALSVAHQFKISCDILFSQMGTIVLNLSTKPFLQNLTVQI